MQRLVCTYNLNDLAYAQHTLPHIKAYATRMNADFRVLQNFKNQELYNLPQWAILEVIKDFAMQNRWDQMLLIDLDVLMLPHTSDIFELCGDQIGVVQDMAIPHCDEGYFEWCERYFRFRPVESRYFNVGVMHFPLAAARRMLNLIHNPFPPEWPVDNHFLNMILNGRESLHWLGHEWNWMAPQYASNLRDYQIIHFAGTTKHMIPKLASQIQI